MNRIHQLTAVALFLGLALVWGFPAAARAADIVHDSEYYVLEAQNGEKWAADDKVVDAKLAEFRAKQRWQAAEHSLHTDR